MEDVLKTIWACSGESLNPINYQTQQFTHLLKWTYYAPFNKTSLLCPAQNTPQVIYYTKL